MTVQKSFVICLFIYVFQALIPYHHLLIFGGHYDVSLSVDENTGIISLEIVMQEQGPELFCRIRAAEHACDLSLRIFDGNSQQNTEVSIFDTGDKRL